MTRSEPGALVIRSDCSVNCATTSVNHFPYFLTYKWTISGHFSFIFVFSTQLTINHRSI